MRTTSPAPGHLRIPLNIVGMSLDLEAVGEGEGRRLRPTYELKTTLQVKSHLASS